MNLLSKLFRTKPKDNPFPKSRHVIKPAFEVDGVWYYEFDNTANLPWKRGLKFLSVYNELDMRCDRFYLTKHVEAVQNILTGGKRVGFDEMVKIQQLNNQLKERLQMVYHEDLVYKVASVVFFDASENPDEWEWEYAMKKIERWKQAQGVHDFFLHEPLQRLIPYLNSGGTDFQLYSEVAKKLDKAHLENIYSNLSPDQRTTLQSSMFRYFWEGMKQGSAK